MLLQGEARILSGKPGFFRFPRHVFELAYTAGSAVLLKSYSRCCVPLSCYVVLGHEVNALVTKICHVRPTAFALRYWRLLIVTPS